MKRFRFAFVLAAATLALTACNWFSPVIPMGNKYSYFLHLSFTDQDGNELAAPLAAEVYKTDASSAWRGEINPEKYKIEVPNVMNKTVSVVDCQYFVTNLLQLQGEMEKDYSNLDSFVILMPLEGFFSLNWENGAVFVNQGECVLIPNVIKKVAIRAEKYCKLLEVYCQLEE